MIGQLRTIRIIPALVRLRVIDDVLLAIWLVVTELTGIGLDDLVDRR